VQLSPEDRTELQQMQRGRKALTARVRRRIRVLLLLDGGHTVRATAIAAGGYPREISRVGKRYLRGGLRHALTEDPRPKTVAEDGQLSGSCGGGASLRAAAGRPIAMDAAAAGPDRSKADRREVEVGFYGSTVQ
jgi:hypothetical protein